MRTTRTRSIGKAAVTTLAELLRARVDVGVAQPVELALVRAAGSETSQWVTADDVRRSCGLGWCAEGNREVQLAEGGVPQHAQRIRFIHRIRPLPWQSRGSHLVTGPSDGASAADDNPSTSEQHGEVLPEFEEHLRREGAARPVQLVFLDIDGVLSRTSQLWHQNLPMTLRRSHAGECGPALPLHNDALLSPLMLEPDTPRFRNVALAPRYPVTAYTFRERFVREPAAADAVERLVALQEAVPGLHFVMCTTHVNWADAAAFRDVMLFPLRVAGCVWPRHIGGVFDWIVRFVSPHAPRVAFACVDDRAEFYDATTVRVNGVAARWNTTSRRLVHVARDRDCRRAHAFVRPPSGPRFRWVGDGETGLVQPADVDAIEAHLEQSVATSLAALHRDSFEV